MLPEEAPSGEPYLSSLSWRSINVDAVPSIRRESVIRRIQAEPFKQASIIAIKPVAEQGIIHIPPPNEPLRLSRVNLRALHEIAGG